MPKPSSSKRNLKVFSPKSTSSSSPASSPPQDSASSLSAESPDTTPNTSFETLLDSLDGSPSSSSLLSPDQIEVEVDPPEETSPEAEPLDPSLESTEQYHLLLIPPEGSVLYGNYSTAQETLAAIERHSEGPVALDQIDQWSVRVFCGREIELVGDIRSGRIALRDGEQVHRAGMVSDDQLQRLAPGSFLPETVDRPGGDLPLSKAPDDIFGGFIGGDDRLF